MQIFPSLNNIMGNTVDTKSKRAVTSRTLDFTASLGRALEDSSKTPEGAKFAGVLRHESNVVTPIGNKTLTMQDLMTLRDKLEAKGMPEHMGKALTELAEGDKKASFDDVLNALRAHADGKAPDLYEADKANIKSTLISMGASAEEADGILEKIASGQAPAAWEQVVSLLTTHADKNVPLAGKDLETLAKGLGLSTETTNVLKNIAGLAEGTLDLSGKQALQLLENVTKEMQSRSASMAQSFDAVNKALIPALKEIAAQDKRLALADNRGAKIADQSQVLILDSILNKEGKTSGISEIPAMELSDEVREAAAQSSKVIDAPASERVIAHDSHQKNTKNVSSSEKLINDIRKILTEGTTANTQQAAQTSQVANETGGKNIPAAQAQTVVENIAKQVLETVAQAAAPIITTVAAQNTAKVTQQNETVAVKANEASQPSFMDRSVAAGKAFEDVLSNAASVKPSAEKVVAQVATQSKTSVEQAQAQADDVITRIANMVRSVSTPSVATGSSAMANKAEVEKLFAAVQERLSQESGIGSEKAAAIVNEVKKVVAEQSFAKGAETVAQATQGRMTKEGQAAQLLNQKQVADADQSVATQAQDNTETVKRVVTQERAVAEHLLNDGEAQTSRSATVQTASAAQAKDVKNSIAFEANEALGAKTNTEQTNNQKSFVEQAQLNDSNTKDNKNFGENGKQRDSFAEFSQKTNSGNTVAQKVTQGSETVDTTRATFASNLETPAPTLASLKTAAPQASYTRQQAAPVANQVQQGMIQAIQNGDKQLTVRLNPVELGALTITLSVNNGEVSAMIRSERAETSQVLTDQLGQIKQSLEEQGFKVDKLDVQTQTNSSDSRSANGESNNSQQQDQQFNASHEQQRLEADRQRFRRLRQIRLAGNEAASEKVIPVQVTQPAQHISSGSLNLIA